MSKNGGTKLCKHCQSEISKNAKVCPVCKRKQGGKLKWIIIAVIVIAVLANLMGDGSDEETASTDNKETVTKKESKEKTEKSTTKATTEEKKEETVYLGTGDSAEIEDGLTMTVLSAGEYQSDNEFIQPDAGKIYYKIDVEFENNSDSDYSISSILNFEAYVDDYQVDEAYIVDGKTLDGTIAAGKKLQGSLSYEIDESWNELEVQYKPIKLFPKKTYIKIEH